MLTLTPLEKGPLGVGAYSREYSTCNKLYTRVATLDACNLELSDLVSPLQHRQVPTAASGRHQSAGCKGPRQNGEAVQSHDSWKFAQFLEHTGCPYKAYRAPTPVLQDQSSSTSTVMICGGFLPLRRHSAISDWGNCYTSTRVKHG